MTGARFFGKGASSTRSNHLFPFRNPHVESENSTEVIVSVFSLCIFPRSPLSLEIVEQTANLDKECTGANKPSWEMKIQSLPLLASRIEWKKILFTASKKKREIKEKLSRLSVTIWNSISVFTTARLHFVSVSETSDTSRFPLWPLSVYSSKHGVFYDSSANKLRNNQLAVFLIREAETVKRKETLYLSPLSVRCWH